MTVMRRARLTMKFTASVLGLALGVAVLASAPARAADDDDDNGADSKFLRSIMEGLGLRKDGPGINYQERAPLVIPSARTLPPPESSDAVVARNPAWPDDPDVKRGQKPKPPRSGARGARPASNSIMSKACCAATI